MRIVKLVASAIVLLGVVAAMAGCDPPAVTGLPLQPNETIIAFNGQMIEITVTFTNTTRRSVRAQVARMIGAGAGNFSEVTSDCFTKSPIAAGGTCISRIRLIRTGNIGATYYMGTTEGRVTGGVRIRQ